MKTLLTVLFFVLSTPVLHADCEGDLVVKKTSKYADFEAHTRQAFAEYLQKTEAQESQRIITLRDQLANIENANPQGFNTYTQRQREGMSVLMRSLLRLGQDRRVKMLTGQLVVESRALYNKLGALATWREEVLQAFLESDFERRNDLDGLIKSIDDQTLAVERDIGRNIWLYSGIVSTLQEEAGMKERTGLLPDGLERALQDDLSNAFTRDEFQGPPNQVHSVAPSQSPEEVSKVAALRVLQALKLVDSNNRELTPSLQDFQNLYNLSAVVRTAKLESEIKFESKQQRAQKLLSLVSDQYVLGIVSAGMNALTLGKFKSFFDSTRQELEKGVNESVHQGRILEFLGLADRLPNDDTGNAQLARALLTLLGTDSTLLSSIALTEEGIEPLRRVKGVDFVKTTIWGAKGQTLVGAIEELEGQRATAGLNSAINRSHLRSHVILKVTAASLITYAAVVQTSVMDNLGNLVLGWFH